MSADFSLDHLDPDEVMPEPELHYFDEVVSGGLINCADRSKYLSSEKGVPIKTFIKNYIERNDISVLSFDVFDTFLLRNNKPEALRYLEISRLAIKKLRQMYPDDKKLRSLTAEDFCQSRIIGMQATYRTRPLVQGCGEGLIDEVFAMQRMVLGLKDGSESVLREAEVEYESKNLKENVILSSLSNEFKNSGGTVILVSDMYLTSNIIADIIKKIIKFPVYDHIYSSADYVVSKRSGKIFSIIEKELCAEGKAVLHIGDSWVGDVKRPREEGWNALYFPVSANEKKERRMALDKFITLMDNKGIETRGWAKL